MAYDDPIVNEVRKARELILEKCQGDMDRFFKFIREEENKNPERLTKPAVVKKSMQKVSL
ncbi:hypothetical protein [Moorella sp. ACPs]|uniref:hypothetical protein n=1 Tax=Neomoorella carbonis TaxID=3062783 RepID=UPI00324E0BBB